MTESSGGSKGNSLALFFHSDPNIFTSTGFFRNFKTYVELAPLNELLSNPYKNTKVAKL